VEEDDATGGRGTSPAEVRGERMADIMDEGEDPLVMGLARTDEETALVPIDIL